MNDDLIFPEEGFPSMAELTASPASEGLSTECSSGARNEHPAAAEGCAAACAANAPAGAEAQKSALACGSMRESASRLSEGETPWLRFIEKYPRYAAEPLPEGMNEAVRAGEDPTMAFLRLENQRLEHDLELLRREQVLRAACMGSAKSAAVPDEPDEFAKGLLMG